MVESMGIRDAAAPRRPRNRKRRARRRTFVSMGWSRGSALVTAAAVVAAGLCVGLGSASAASAPVTATLTARAIGQRTVAATPTLGLVTGGGGVRLEGEFVVAIDEMARAGTSDWTLVMHAAPLPGTSGDATTVAGRRAVRYDSAGVATVPAGTAALAGPVTLLRQSGQAAGRLYTGSHIARAHVSMPLPAAGAASGFVPVITLTLVQ